jgi:hypothetical protein
VSADAEGPGHAVVDSLSSARILARQASEGGLGFLGDLDARRFGGVLLNETDQQAPG